MMVTVIRLLVVCNVFWLAQCLRLPCTASISNYETQSSLEHCILQHLEHLAISASKSFEQMSHSSAHILEQMASDSTKILEKLKVLYYTSPKKFDRAQTLLSYLYGIPRLFQKIEKEEAKMLAIILAEADHEIPPKDDETLLDYLRRLYNWLAEEWESANQDPKFKAKKLLRSHISSLINIIEILGPEKLGSLHFILQPIASAWEYLAVLADFVQYELEIAGYPKLGAVVGALGNTLSGVMAGGSTGGLKGFGIWLFGEVADNQTIEYLEKNMENYLYYLDRLLYYLSWII